MRPFDISKFRKDITKSIPGVSLGFHDPKTWINSGNYALNYAISGNFNYGIPLGKVTMFAGQSGSGKSFICSGNVVRNAQKQGIFPILIDTENALDENWLKPLGVDTNDDKLLKINMAMIDDVARLISDFMKDYKDKYEKVEPEERPKVLFVLDSLGMLLTPTDVNQFEAGDLKGDMGRKPKALAALVRNCVNMFGEYEVGLVVTNHSYASQDMFDPDDKISGGQGFVYASSIVVAMRKLKLKEDEDGKKVTDVRGIRAACKIMKTRYNKPFESVEIKIPWDTGMDAYSGLVDLFEKKGVLAKDGNKLKYTDKNGKEHKYFRSGLTDELLDLIMNEWDENKVVSQLLTASDSEETEASDTEE
jgi:RecA/RadA recombinase